MAFIKYGIEIVRLWQFKQQQIRRTYFELKSYTLSEDVRKNHNNIEISKNTIIHNVPITLLKISNQERKILKINYIYVFHKSFRLQMFKMTPVKKNSLYCCKTDDKQLLSLHRFGLIFIV